MRALLGTVVAIAGATLAAGCGSSGTAPTTTVGSGTAVMSPQAQKIALARGSNGLFSIFPARPGRKTCAIPAGGLRTKPIMGMCSTSLRRGRTHEPAWIVSFTEYWTVGPRCPPGDHCGPTHGFQHTWRVIEAEPVITPGARWRIAATRESGAIPPQLYY